MVFTRWLCLISTLMLLAGCVSQPAVQPVNPTATIQIQPSATAVPLTATAVPRSTATITPAAAAPLTFEACAARGGLILNSFPRTCRTASGTVLEEPLPPRIRFSRFYSDLTPTWAVPASDGGALITGSTIDGGFVMKVDAGGRQVWLDSVGSEIETPHNGEHSFTCWQARESAEGGFSVLCYVFHRTSTERYWLQYNQTGQRTGAELIKPKPGMALRLDAQGAPTWVPTFGLGEGRLVETADGGYALLVVTSFNGRDDRTYLVRADAQQHYAWDRLLCSLTGLTPEANQIPCQRNNLHDIVQTADGGFALTGSDDTKQGAYLLKVDAQGRTEWLHYYPDEDAGWAMRYSWSRVVHQLPDGGYLIAGTHNAGTLLLRTDKAGRPMEKTIFGDSISSYPVHLVTLTNGDLLLVGMSRPPGSEKDVLWLVGVDGKY